MWGYVRNGLQIERVTYMMAGLAFYRMEDK